MIKNCFRVQLGGSYPKVPNVQQVSGIQIKYRFVFCGFALILFSYLAKQNYYQLDVALYH